MLMEFRGLLKLGLYHRPILLDRTGIANCVKPPTRLDDAILHEGIYFLLKGLKGCKVSEWGVVVENLGKAVRWNSRVERFPSSTLPFARVDKQIVKELFRIRNLFDLGKLGKTEWYLTVGIPRGLSNLLFFEDKPCFRHANGHDGYVADSTIRPERFKNLSPSALRRLLFRVSVNEETITRIGLHREVDFRGE